MKKKTLSAMALFFFGLLLLGVGNSNSQEYPQGIVTMYGQSDVTGWDTFEASRMIGSRLVTRTGDSLGQISDLVIDSENGHILEVILSDVRGRGGEQVAVPFAALSHTGSSIFVFNEPEEYSGYFTNAGGSYFEDLSSQWNEIRFFYSVLPLPAGAYRVSAWMGAPVRTSKGEEVGWVNDFVIDFTKSQLVYLALSDVGGTEGRMVAVPFKELSSEGGEMLTLHTSKEKLLDSPTLTSADMADRTYAEHIYRYYGVQPYWEEM
jgi:sporulation protein YlmC with PRC-barrel domain